MPNDDEEDLTEDQLAALQKIAKETIETYATEYLDKFNSDVLKCKSIYEYYSLIVSVLVFEKLAMSQLFRELEALHHDGVDPNEIILILESMANDISEKVVSGFIQKSMN